MFLSEIGTVTGEEPAERVEMSLGHQLPVKKKPGKEATGGKPQNSVIIAS